MFGSLIQLVSQALRYNRVHRFTGRVLFVTNTLLCAGVGGLPSMLYVASSVSVCSNPPQPTTGQRVIASAH